MSKTFAELFAKFNPLKQDETSPINKDDLLAAEAAGIEIGIKQERERIIALLDRHLCLYLYGYTECGGDSDTCVGKEELHNRKLLELIKGGD